MHQQDIIRTPWPLECREMRYGKPECLSCAIQRGYGWIPKRECEGSEKLLVLVPATKKTADGGAFRVQSPQQVVTADVSKIA